MKMNNNTKLALGVLAGAAIGYLLGTMLAPKRGSELRSDVMDSLSELGNNVGDLLSQGKEKLSSLTHLNGEELEQEAADAAWKAGRQL